jgi:hypothetical protein
MIHCYPVCLFAYFLFSASCFLPAYLPTCVACLFVSLPAPLVAFIVFFCLFVSFSVCICFSVSISHLSVFLIVIISPFVIIFFRSALRICIHTISLTLLQATQAGLDMRLSISGTSPLFQSNLLALSWSPTLTMSGFKPKYAGTPQIRVGPETSFTNAPGLTIQSILSGVSFIIHHFCNIYVLLPKSPTPKCSFPPFNSRLLCALYRAFR